MMSVTIDLPEEVERHLAEQWDNLPQRALEAIALEGYRSEALSAGQVAEILHLSVWETEAFLRERRAELRYTAEDFEKDMAANQQILFQ